jgi:hypothetical protein
VAGSMQDILRITGQTTDQHATDRRLDRRTDRTRRRTQGFGFGLQGVTRHPTNHGVTNPFS